LARFAIEYAAPGFGSAPSARNGRASRSSVGVSASAASSSAGSCPGYDAMTIGAVAARAGVGRQTFYRWWASKSAIIGEAVLEGVVGFGEFGDESDEHAEAGHPGSPDAWLRRFAAATRTPDGAALVRALSSAAAEDAAESEALYATVTRPAHAELTALLAASGASAHASVLADAAIGALLYRTLSREGASAEYVEELIAALLR
jgi:AcrR family transcriptional regulator